MLKALLRKQFQEIIVSMTRSSKPGKKQSKASVVLYGFLWVLVGVSIATLFAMFGNALAPILKPLGLGGVYFGITGGLAILLATFVNMFSASNMLYRAKDNDFLLSMPIPPSAILFARMFTLYLVAFVYILFMIVPTFFTWGGATVTGILLMPFAALFVLLLSALLGWMVSYIASKIKNLKVLRTVIVFALLAVYYLFVGRLESLMQSFTDNILGFYKGFRVWGWLFMRYGEGAAGSLPHTLIFMGIIVAAFALLYVLLSRSFFGIATARHEMKRVVYREKTARVTGLRLALWKREGRRFLSSTTYMLNCGMGLFMILLAAGFLLVRGAALHEMLLLVSEGEDLSILMPFAAAAICFVLSMLDISAPSVSLEGNTLWLMQSLPVPAKDALRAKTDFHRSLAVPGTVILWGAVMYVLRPALVYAVMILLIAIAFVFLHSAAGLALNLKMPNLTWTNEAVPIKQSLPVCIELFGGWVVNIAFGVGSFFLFDKLPAIAWMLIVFAVFVLGTVALELWLKKRGAKIFETL